MEKIRINRNLVSVLTLAGAFMLAGCGSGGVTGNFGNGGDPVPPLTPEEQAQAAAAAALTDFERTTTASLSSIADVAVRQSRREGDRAGRGDVYAQVSGNGGPYEVAVSVDDVGGALVYEWSRTYSGATPLTLTVNSGIDMVLDQQAPTSADDVSSVFLYKELADGGKLWVGFNTDYVGTGDSDYLVGGIWSYAPGDPTSDHEFGAFAYGNDIFAQAGGILDLGGPGGTDRTEVVYSGKARGIYTAEQQNRFFDASITLTAGFDLQGDRIGLVGGMQDFRMKLEDGRYEAFSDSFYLQGDLPDTGVNYAGSFTGRICGGGARCQANDGDDIGKFGGQFYGNEATATSTDYPRSIAGTFGATQDTAEGQRSFLGAFGLRKP